MPDNNREYNGSYTVLQKLLPQHYQILDLHLSGHKAPDISKILGISSRQVYNALNSPRFQNELSIRRAKLEDHVDESIIRAKDQVQEVIKQNTLAAINRLVQLTDQDENPSVARQAANDILDRGGYPKISRQETEVSQSLVLENDQAALIKPSAI